MSKTKGKDLMQHLRATNKTEFGTVIMAAEVRAVIGLDYPDTASKRVFDGLALMELAAIDYCRNVLLGEGKYIGQHQGNYRILLPGENAEQVKRYMKGADKKLGRALKLWDNSPPVDTVPPDANLGARILLKQHGIKRSVLGADEVD